MSTQGQPPVTQATTGGAAGSRFHETYTEAALAAELATRLAGKPASGAAAITTGSAAAGTTPLSLGRGGKRSARLPEQRQGEDCGRHRRGFDRSGIRSDWPAVIDR